MAKFRKKPVVIDAMQWNGRDDETGIKAALDFIDIESLPRAPDDPHIHNGIGFTPADGKLYIPTLEGTVAASPGDWIIRGAKGEYYPCKPDIFAETYEPAETGRQIVSENREAELKNEAAEFWKRSWESLAEALKTCAAQRAELRKAACEFYEKRPYSIRHSEEGERLWDLIAAQPTSGDTAKEPVCPMCAKPVFTVKHGCTHCPHCGDRKPVCVRVPDVADGLTVAIACLDLDEGPLEGQ